MSCIGAKNVSLIDLLVALQHQFITMPTPNVMEVNLTVVQTFQKHKLHGGMRIKVG